VALLGLVTHVFAAEPPPRVALDNNEALFTVLTAINACGYDSELDISDPLRSQIRGEVAKAIEASAEAKESTQVLCQFYAEHQPADPGRTLAQYVSLALYLDAPPGFALKVKETDLPPDASYVSGFVPLIQKFYVEAGLHTIWSRHQSAYSDLTARYHEPLSKVLFDTEVYLKLPSAGYLGRTFTVYLDPMGAPGEANARDYGTDYYVVISPGPESGLKIDQIRHTYLHYLLDPLALKYPIAMSHLAPLLLSVKSAPMDESFKTDASLLATECLIRAVEAHTVGSSKTPETQRQQLVEQSAEQGFILTPYFYEALVKFEKSPAGLRIAYSDLINGIDVHKEQKNAAQIKFASNADPELLHLSRPTDIKLLVSAEQRLSSGDAQAARKLAQQALDEKREDPGRAYFILAQAAAMSRDMPGARNYFEQALSVAHEPKVLAWSHIYLGRIYDLQDDRTAALDQYRAALTAGGSLPEAKAAAEHGIEQPYEPPSTVKE
jgi:hypothetical protein